MSKDQHRVNLLRQKQRLAFDFKDLLAGTEELLNSTASYTGAEIEEARSRLKHQLEDAKQAAGQWNQAAAEQYRRTAQATDDYVRERPWTFIAVAAAIGIVIGHCAHTDKQRR